MSNKIPPAEKIMEAWTCIVDKRIHLLGPADSCSGEATVAASDRQKTYKIKWDGNTYASTDSATYWQGYPGYPVIALLMLQGKIPFSSDCAVFFSGINWHMINKQARGDYTLALDKVYTQLGIAIEQRKIIQEQAMNAYNDLLALPIVIKRYILPRKGRS